MVEARIIGPDPGLAAWATAALPRARTALAGEDRRAGGTWAVGLDLLDNAPDGSIDGVSLPWATFGLTPTALHRAQLSAIYPGYPQPDPDDPPTAHRYRLSRDAAHLDGLLPIGPKKRRMVKEPHAWIVGIPLGDCPAAPLVVWPGSAAVLRRALHDVLWDHPPETWGDVDVTEAYTSARKRVFEICPRTELPVKCGQATILHRLTLHGVAPWASDCQDPDRIIAYFRPQLPTVHDWLCAP